MKKVIMTIPDFMKKEIGESLILKVVELKEEFYIKHSDSLYGMISDSWMARSIEMTTHKYRNILRKNGAIISLKSWNLFFKTKEQAEKAIATLEPYLIMKKLTG